MKKLAALKPWLTIPEAARHLAEVWKEDVTEGDVLRLALDGQLKLSIRFLNRAAAKCSKKIPVEQAKRYALPAESIEGALVHDHSTWLAPQKMSEHVERHPPRCPMSLFSAAAVGAGNNQFLELENTIVYLTDVWDLPMLGVTPSAIERRILQLADGPSVPPINSFDGFFVENTDGRSCQACQLQQRFSVQYLYELYPDDAPSFLYRPEYYFTARELPDDCELVVRSEALAALTAPATDRDSPLEQDTAGVDLDESKHDEVLAALFDPVPVAALEKMFPATSWKKWAERAARNGLSAARRGRGVFNPYLAADWFLKLGLTGWDRAHCNRVLAKNLPARSHDKKHLLTGDFD